MRQQPYRWRWDQGRLDYFRFDRLVKIAKVLNTLQGVGLNAGHQDALRPALEDNTGLPFSPKNYTVWRNYKRVFGSALLATDTGGYLAITGICRWLAAETEDPVNVDEYLSLLAPRFYFPFPAFQDYSADVTPTFPFSASLKYLLAAIETQREASLSLQDVFALIIGNHCTGLESVEHYVNLPTTPYMPVGDEERQVRELLIFLSQSSFLKWHRNRLYLDVRAGDVESIDVIKKMAEPLATAHNADAAQEILTLGAFPNLVFGASADTTRREPADVVFTEGKRVRVMHLRAERSPYLRQWFFSRLTRPYLCDMCRCDPKTMYPWTENILEVHHLLPLSSALTVTGTGTSLQDIVALCPNCHKSVHTFYKTWLNSATLNDFRSRQEAAGVYQEAKGMVIQ